MPAPIIPQTSGIYLITCTANDLIYVGSSKDLRYRKSYHFSTLRGNCHHNQHLQNAWNKYGEEAFTFEVLELVMPWCIIEREQYWIDKLKPFRKRGFNIRPKADSAEISAETKAKLSAINTGKTASIETRQKQSAALKGRPKSPEHSRRVGEARSKSYVVTSPEGTEYNIRNLSNFCRESGLCQSAMCGVANGVHAQHKGWKCRHEVGHIVEKRSSSAETALKISNAVSKNWIVTMPDGTVTEVRNLTKFCLENGLSHSAMNSVSRGNQPDYKGWKVRPTSPDADTAIKIMSRLANHRGKGESTLKNWVITSPDGVETQVCGLRDFCLENGLSRTRMSAVANGKQENHKGWKCRHAD